MDNVLYKLWHDLNSPMVFTAFIGTLVTLAGIMSTSAIRNLFLGRMSSFVLSSGLMSSRTLDSASETIRKSPSQVARLHIEARLKEAEFSQKEQQRESKSSKTTSTLLVIGQYIIGGVLASSFIQESLTPKLVGCLGVVVLIASLFRQQFHPEINAEDARKKASQLKALIRFSEDQLSILDAQIAAGQDHTDAMIALMSQITQRLTEIESPEAVAPTRST